MLRSKRAHISAIVFERSSFTDGKAPTDSEADAAMGVLQELDATYLRVRRGDDLVNLFNT